MAVSKLLPWMTVIFTIILHLATANSTNIQRDRLIADPSNLVNISTFPECGKADCITSQVLPTYFGCNATTNDNNETISSDCLCNKSVIPLSCLQRNPANKDSCWKEAEDWVSSTCGKINLIDTKSLPSCLTDCFLTHLNDSGYQSINGSVSRNCFCKISQLSPSNLTTEINHCKKANCWKRVHPAFSYEAWREAVCVKGVVKEYDQKAYDSYVTTIKRTRAAMAGVIPVVAFLLAAIAGFFAETIWPTVGFWVLFNVVFYVGILVPLYVAL